jgi:hypothetical protein
MFGVDVGMSAELGGSLVATLGNYIPGALCIRELFLSSLNGVHRETRSRGHMPKNLQRRCLGPALFALNVISLTSLTFSGPHLNFLSQSTAVEYSASIKSTSLTCQGLPCVSYPEMDRESSNAPSLIKSLSPFLSSPCFGADT